MALSDPGEILASPLTIIECRDDTAAIAAITAIISQHDVKRVIVGLPRSMDGSLGAQAEKVQTFVHKLASITRVPIDFRDERLTTVAARRLLRAAGGKKARRKARDDAAAAAVILQGYLEEGHQADF